jgi:nucleoside-triphosphatase THEP1
MMKVRISFEGPPGSGKSVLSRFVREALEEKGVKCGGVVNEEDDLVLERNEMRKIFLGPDHLDGKFGLR